MRSYLENVALVTDLDKYDADYDQVSLMTLHSAKGLEFPIVFLAGLEEGVFPHSRSLLEPGELEEERRLCYVGVTRAMQHLYLTHCWKRTLLALKIQQAFRFLRNPGPPFSDDNLPENGIKKDRPGMGRVSLLGKVLGVRQYLLVTGSGTINGARE